jgi:DNA-binding response OmpR family regulator
MIILIVDDDVDTRDVVNLTLSSRGYSVKTAESLYGALDILKQRGEEKIGLILLDWNLPGMPVREFLAEVDKICPNVPIALSTAAYRVQDKAKQCGLKFWLPKPIFPDDLVALVEHVLNSNSGASKTVSA